MDRTLPTKAQLDFMDWEFGLFFHYGIRTFYEGHTDWDGKYMDPAGFLPSEQDCRQWARAAKAAGAAYGIMTAKHHDGFALWPSAYTEYGVKASPWKDGKGDAVREFLDAFRAEGLKVGLYYSPAQFGSLETDPKAYDDYFVNQITELLTGYGKLDYLWFDGCGSDGHSYDRARIVGTIRALQPEILLFGMWDPDTRWVGNEEGYAHADAPYLVEAGAEELVGGMKFLPYECDCKLHPDSWFYSDAAAPYVRSLPNLLGLWELSVGRGGNLLLNVAPDRRGLLPESDAALLARFGSARRARYAEPVLSRGACAGAEFCLNEAPTGANADCLVLREDLKNGAYGGEYRFVYVSGGDETLLSSGSAVGHKRIVRFPAVQLGRWGWLRLEFSKPVALRDLALYGPKTEDNQ